MTVRVAILVAFAASFLLAAPAAARSPSRDVEVRYADLDLTSEPGASALLRRLERAAAQACDAANVSFRDYRATRNARACKTRAMSRAVAEIDAPLVQSLYAAMRHEAVRVASLK